MFLLLEAGGRNAFVVAAKLITSRKQIFPIDIMVVVLLSGGGAKDVCE